MFQACALAAGLTDGRAAINQVSRDSSQLTRRVDLRTLCTPGGCLHCFRPRVRLLSGRGSERLAGPRRALQHEKSRCNFKGSSRPYRQSS